MANFMNFWRENFIDMFFKFTKFMKLANVKIPSRISSPGVHAVPIFWLI